MQDDHENSVTTEVTSSSSYIFENLNIFDYIGAAFFIAGPAWVLIKLYIIDFINNANEVSIRYDLAVGKTPEIATISIKTFIFSILLSAIGYVFISWGRKT